MEAEKLIRKNIKSLLAYSTARDEAGQGYSIYLDANESPFNNGMNRYPDPRQGELKKMVSSIKGVPGERIFAANGSDEAIDLLYRIFCEPGKDNAVAISPSYGMYGVAAAINNVEFREVLLREDFSLDTDALLAATDSSTKLVFLCSPNNPTGNILEKSAVEKIARNFEGILVIDEAYIDFSNSGSFLSGLDDYPNLVVLQTLSKAWGMAGLRIGFAFASESIISVMSKVKYPYNIGEDTLKKAVCSLQNSTEKRIKAIVEERQRVAFQLERLPDVIKVYPGEANFLLVKFRDSHQTYNKLINNGIVVRERSSLPLCDQTLRITIGTPGENNILLAVLRGDDRVSGESGKVICVRETNETSVRVELELYSRSFRQNVSEDPSDSLSENLSNQDLKPETFVDTGLPFFDHMLEQLAFHSGISLILTAKGDIDRDEHHTVEDCAIVLGEAFDKALGSRKGISRYGFTLPMDESLARVAIDLGGRSYLRWNVKFESDRIGGIDRDMFRHFFYTLSVASRSVIHISAKGENDHHKVEAIFKAYARAFGMALRKEESLYELPSTKGII
jgi:histidinol-phosphate aminotransferase